MVCSDIEQLRYKDETGIQRKIDRKWCVSQAVRQISGIDTLIINDITGKTGANRGYNLPGSYSRSALRGKKPQLGRC